MKGFSMSAGPAPSAPPLPWRFFLVAISVAIAVGAIIIYLGLTGHIGAGVTGEKSPGGGLVSLPFAAVSLLGMVHARGVRTQ